jgi:hypothetical protein
MNNRVCPECYQGKHVNCDGLSWDFAIDEYVVCPCYRVDHDKTRLPKRKSPQAKS